MAEQATTGLAGLLRQLRAEARLTQQELATLVGAAETTVHKVLRELRDEGLLETGYRATVIRKLPRLSQLADLADE